MYNLVFDIKPYGDKAEIAYFITCLREVCGAVPGCELIYVKVTDEIQVKVSQKGDHRFDMYSFFECFKQLNISGQLYDEGRTDTVEYFSI